MSPPISQINALTPELLAQAKAWIKPMEALKLKAYQDTGGIWTIGWGHTGLMARAGIEINEAGAEMLLEEDIKQAFRIVKTGARVPITANETLAMLSLCFNIGAGQFLRSTMLKKLNMGDVPGAADAFMNWVYDNGKKLDDLVTRRTQEKALFLKP